MQYLKARVVSKEAKIAFSRLRRPPDEAIPAGNVARRRTPRHAGDRTAVGEDQILQMFSDRLFVTQIVMVFNQAVEQRLISCAPHLTQFVSARESPGPRELGWGVVVRDFV